MADAIGSRERRAFLDERRRSAQARYDEAHAATYDSEAWAAISPTHERFLARFLELVRPRGLVLDMPCGTGKYFAPVLASGRSVVGFDQSVGMLEVGRKKHPGVPTARLALQDLTVEAAFDGVLCMDSMEFVGPEDWPRVLGALRDAGRAAAPLYLTVELPNEAKLAADVVRAREAGQPVTPRESFDADRGGYHHYPERDTVLGWLDETGLAIAREGEGDWYWHLLLQRA